MDINLKVLKAIVLTGRGTDRISIELDAPQSFPGTTYPSYINVEALSGYGAEWCRTVLGLEPEVINAGGVVFSDAE